MAALQRPRVHREHSANLGAIPRSRKVPTMNSPLFWTTRAPGVSVAAMRTFAPIALAIFGLMTYGCSSTSSTTKTPPTCAQLQTQINACTNISQAGKDLLGPFCATASDACRSCLDGQLCGVTEQCDPQCGKIGDAGGGG